MAYETSRKSVYRLVIIAWLVSDDGRYLVQGQVLDMAYAAGARRLGAIGDLWALRAPEDDIEKRYWAIDGYAGLVVEVAAAMRETIRRHIQTDFA